MDLLRTAVVDITTLVSAYRALSPGPGEDAAAIKPGLRRRLRREIKRGTLAYIDTLARSRRGFVDDGLLGACRLAAERQMARALRHHDRLARELSSRPGAMDGIAAARQDLWRLAHTAIQLQFGIAALREAGDGIDAEPVLASTAALRRRLRKALVAYARATMRAEGAGQVSLLAAREAAWAQIGRRGAADAERIAQAEVDAATACTVVRRGVLTPLRDIALDWHGR